MSNDLHLEINDKLRQKIQKIDFLYAKFITTVNGYGLRFSLTATLLSRFGQSNGSSVKSSTNAELPNIVQPNRYRIVNSRVEIATRLSQLHVLSARKLNGKQSLFVNRLLNHK